MGGLGSMFGSSNPGFSPNDINKAVADRSAQIGDFSNQLSSMRSQYLAQIPGLATSAYNQFGGDQAAKFGANGIGVDSGAFASSLARYAIPAQASMINTGYQTGVQNAGAVNSAYGQLAQERIGALSAGMSRPQPNPLGGAIGQFAGQAGMMALGSYLFPGAGPIAGMEMGKLGSSAMGPMLQGQSSGGSVAQAATSDGSDWVD